MDKDLKDERNSKRWDKTCKIPFRRLIRLHDADVFMRSEEGRKIDAAIHAEIYERDIDKHFKKLWDQINKTHP